MTSSTLPYWGRERERGGERGVGQRTAFAARSAYLGKVVTQDVFVGRVRNAADKDLARAQLARARDGAVAGVARGTGGGTRSHGRVA